MSKLSPMQAIMAAKNVYDVMEFDSGLSRFFDPRIADNFSIPDSSRFKGTSGGVFLKNESGFGIIAKGKNITNQNEALVIFRGTAKLTDWLTDAHASYENNSRGQKIHAGFNRVFKSVEGSGILRQFFNENHPQVIHCVGHSLGGALATLMADWSLQYGAKPVLYTFGSPRVGFTRFATNLTQRVGAENIYRVYHKTDPVGMVPLWPYSHVPNPGTACYLGYPGVLDFSSHKCANYVASVQANSANGWASLLRNPPKTNSTADIKQWLATGKPLQLTYPVVVMISHAISYVLKECATVIGIALTGADMAISCFLDGLAYVLSAASKLLKESLELVRSLVLRILSAIGIAIDTTKEMTYEFIRWVFTKLAEALYRLARNAARIDLT